MSLRSLFRDFVPPIARRALGHVTPAAYQGVASIHDLSALTTADFGDAFARFGNLDPHAQTDDIRLRVYFLHLFAALAPRGPILCAGISYGVSARILFELMPGRPFILIDPLTGADEVAKGARPSYNQSLEYVLNQYPPRSQVKFVRAPIPDCFPLDELASASFIHLNTGVTSAEVASLPYLWEKLSPGGFIVIDRYAFGRGNRAAYDPVLASIAAQSFTLPTGQGVVYKAHVSV